MSDKTGIESTDATWNPTKGCDRVSAGCDHCYAMTQAVRLKGMGSAAYQLDGDPKTSGPGFLAHEWPNALDWPLRKTKPLLIFVNSMSDLFHDNITDEYIAKVFAVMMAADQHTFQVLTKRHARMRSLVSDTEFMTSVWQWCIEMIGPERAVAIHGATAEVPWPLPNVWLGVSVENQQWADIRIPALLNTPAAVRFLSCEPLLGSVQLARWLTRLHDCDRCEGSGSVDVPGGGRQCPDCGFDARAGLRDGIDWVIVGGESGPGARPMHTDWARSLRDQCVSANVAFLFKQWGECAPWDQMTPAGQRRAEDMCRSVLDDDSTRHQIFNVGKRLTGRELDGRTWDEYPVAVQ